MKLGNRALAVLLSLVITLSYMPAMAFAGTEEGGEDPSGNGNVESGLEVENEDQTSTGGGDTANDVEESNVQEEQAESNTPTANQQEPEEESVLLGTESDDTEPVEEYVASIGDAKYSTVADALAAAKAGETIKLLGDIDLSKESITSGGYAAIGESCDVVLDLNGHAVTGAALDLYGKMVVDDSSSNKTGSITGVKHAIWVNPNATLEVKAGSVISGTGVAIASDNGNVTITGGEVRNDTGAQAISATDGKIDITGGKIISTKDDTPAIGVYGKCEATVTGGAINGHDWGITVIGTSTLTVSGDAVIGTSETEGIGISTNGNSGQNATITINGGTISGTNLGIYQPSGTVTVNGGSISGATGIYQKSGKLTITNGTITGSGEKSKYDYNGNGAHATGDAIVVDNCGYPGGAPTPSITGGTFNSTNATSIGSYAYTAEGQEANEPVKGFVSGGSFNKAVDNSLCVEGFAPATEPDEDGMYVIVDDHAVSIGNTKYVTLAEALNAANSGDTLTLLKDVTENIIVASDKKVTLDLNGHSLTNASKEHTVTVKGSLTVKDSAEGGKIVSTSNCGICVSGGRLTFNNGAVEAQEMAILFIDAGIGAINSGTFTAKDNAVLGTNGSTGRGGNVINVNGGTFNGNIQTAGYVACGIYAPNDDTWNLNGGTFNITAGAGIVARAGKINIPAESKVQFNTTGNATGKVGDSRVVVPCSAIVFDSQAAYPGLTDKATIAVAGGTFKSEAAAVTAITADGAADKTYVAVSGGSYSSEVPESCCDYGFVPIKQDDGSYSVKKTDVAVIGDKTYPTLAEAVEAASDGDTIKMIADEKLRASVTVDKTLTLDLNGKKVFYDTESHLHKVLTIKGKDKTVTVTDTSEGKTGELNATASPTGSQDRCVEVVEGTFVVEGGTIAGPLFGIYNDRGGTTKINGGTVTGEVTIRSHGSLEMTGGSMKAKSTAISLWPGSTTKITGGTLDCDEVGIELYKANEEGFSTLDITDCELVTRWTTTNASTIISRGGNKITISGGSFTCKRSHSGRDTDMSFCTGDAVSISGGKFSLFAVYESQQPDLTITGGYFQNDISKYVKEPYRCVSDSTYERYPYRVGKFVASIQTESTETYYETFEEAVAAASAGDTIKLLSDVELTSTQNIDKNLVIDLNGNDIAAAGARALWIKSGNVEITGSGNISATGEKLGETSSVIRVGDGAANANKAKLTVGKDVVVSTDKSYGITVFGNNDSDGDKTTSDIELVLNGKVNVTGRSSAVSGNGTSTLSATTMTIGSDAEVTATKDYAIYHPGKGTLTVNGKVEGLGGIEIKGGNIVINDGATIKATATEQSHTAYNDGASTSGYAIAAVNNPGYAGEPKVEINGGEITGVAIILADFDAENNGSITATTDKIAVPEGYKWVANEEGGYDLAVKEYVTVTFDLNGTKTEAKIEKGSKVDNWPADPTKDNYEFIGWTNGETTYDKNSVFNGDITLTATWVEAHATAINNGKLGYWRSLHRACEAADTGTTVTLLVDEEESKIINLSKTVTIDLNGHTWTYTGDRDNAIALTGQGNVTFKDSSNTNSGVLKTSTAKHLIYNNTKSLTIYGGTYEGKESAVYHVNDSSKTRLDGGVFIGAAGKSVGYGYDTKHNISIGKNAYFNDDAGNGNVFTRDDGWYLIKGADESKPDLYKLGQPAAIIGNQYYGSLNAAIKAANASDTVKLVNDVELSKTQEITKDVKIDLNGHNIAATGARALWIKSGNVEITGSGTISATGEELGESSSVIRVGDGAANTSIAKLTVGKDVVVSTDKSYGITVFGKNPNPITLELKGKVSVTGNSAAISGNGSAGLSPTSILIAEGAEVTSANEYAIYHPEDGTLTVNGKVEGKGGIEIKSGKLIVGDSANITANSEPKYSGVNNNGPSTSGYAIASVGNGGYANVPAVEVQGGSIAGTVTSVLENNAEKSGEVTATSDQISVPEGYAWKEENGHYVLKTPLDFEKEAANKELDKVDIEQYSYDDLTKIRAAIEKARADVEAAKTVEDVEAALATFNEEKAECKTNAEKLAEAKSAANKQLDEYKPADYSGDDKAAVESAISKAKAAIEGAKTIEEVDAAVAEAKGAIAACTTDAQKLDNAKANANAQLDAVDKTGLSEADAAKVEKAIADAKAAIDKATTVDAVNDALTAANATIADIKSDASKLAGAKDLAENQLDAIDITQYSGDELEAVKKAIADAKTAIDEAATVSAVNKALTDANSTIAEQKTDAQKAADALQSAKDVANAELNAIDTSNYSGDDLKAVKDAIAAARTAIETAKDVDAVTAAKSTALDTVSKQKTNAQKEAEKLAAAKDAALAELGKIDKTKYSGDDLKAVEKAIADAKTAIEAAETVNAVNAAVKTAEDAVAGQKTDEQKTAEALQNAKDEALAELDKIDLADYSGDDLKTMSAAIKAAKAAIKDASSTDAVANAMKTYTDATKDCKTDEEKAEEATEENADKKLKEAEDAAKAAQTAAETAEASKTAAEAAAKTPGQTAVDAAQKALDDANAAKQAADEAKAKAEAAKTAAEAAYGADSRQAKDAQTLVDNATTAANNAATAVTNAQSAVTNAKNAKASADRAAAANKEIQDLPVVKITKPKAKKKKAVVRWKKVSKKNKKKIQGIQIQVATDPGFKNIVKNTTAKKTKKSKTIKGLKSKTRYWVRIRAYKNVGSVRHVSAWKVKKVKVK